MDILKLIFYKIYCWQRKVDNCDPLWGTIFGLSASFTVVLSALIFFIMFLVGRKYFVSIVDEDFFLYSLAITIIFFPIMLALILVPNRKYLKILYQMHRKYKNTYKWLALVIIIFPVLLLFIAVMLFIQQL